MKVHLAADASINQTFENAFSRDSATDEPITPGKSVASDLIFVRDDILGTSDMLTQLLRGIFVKNGITYTLLSEKYQDYAINRLGVLPSKVSTSKGNLISAIKRPKVTFKKFFEVVALVLGYQLDMTFELTDSSGTNVRYNHAAMLQDLVNTRSATERSK